MAKTLVKLENKLRVKYLVKPKKYYLFYGNQQITIKGNYQDGFKTKDEAIEVGSKLTIRKYYTSRPNGTDD